MLNSNPCHIDGSFHGDRVHWAVRVSTLGRRLGKEHLSTVAFSTGDVASHPVGAHVPFALKQHPVGGHQADQGSDAREGDQCRLVQHGAAGVVQLPSTLGNSVVRGGGISYGFVQHSDRCSLETASSFLILFSTLVTVTVQVINLDGTWNATSHHRSPVRRRGHPMMPGHYYGLSKWTRCIAQVVSHQEAHRGWRRASPMPAPD